MSLPLPEECNLEQLKNQAKDLLNAHREGDVSVCDTYRLTRRFSKLTDHEILDAAVSLQETQYALALAYGFKGWKELKTHVETVRLWTKADELHFGILANPKGNARARELYKKAIEITPHDPHPRSHAMVGLTYLKDFLWNDVGREALDLARNWTKKAISLKSDPNFHMQLASVYAYGKEKDLTIAELDKVVSLAPDSAYLRARTASLYAGGTLSMRDKAVEVLEEARRIGPKGGSHLNYVGRVYAALGKQEKSDEVYQERVTRASAKPSGVSAPIQSSFALPDNEVKGWLIGLEGRKMAAFQDAAGVKMIIDDMSRCVTLSGFDPARLEVARISMMKLLSDCKISVDGIADIVKEAEEEMALRSAL